MMARLIRLKMDRVEFGGVFQPIVHINDVRMVASLGSSQDSICELKVSNGEIFHVQVKKVADAKTV